MEDWNTHLHQDGMRAYRAKRDQAHQTVISKYSILGFISSGTYGRVYKAKSHHSPEIYAIKKFKPDKEGDVVTYTGISQSAIREIAVGIQNFILFLPTEILIIPEYSSTERSAMKTLWR